MMFFKKDNKFSIDEMIKMEDELRSSELYSMTLNADDPTLSEKLNLSVQYVDDMDDDNEAELLPIDQSPFLGLIRLRKVLKKHRFAYIHEIIHYIFDVGYGNKVSAKFTRKRKGKTDTQEEQKTNYLTAAYVMPYEKMLAELELYDSSKPKMDELKFIHDLQKKYEQEDDAVVRRIREVRRLEKNGYSPTTTIKSKSLPGQGNGLTL